MSRLLPIMKENASTLMMSSIEIAELCEKQHPHVLRDIRNMLNELYPNLDSPDFKGIFVVNGETGLTKEIRLPKREVMILVSGYRIDLRAKIIDRLEELENQNQPKLISYPEALRQLADKIEENQVLQLEKKQQSDHIESMTSYFRQGMTAPQLVKGLNGVNSTQINAFLQKKNWLYRDQRGEWRVTSYARDVYMTEEANEFTPHGCDPIIKYKPTLLKKGAAKLYEWYAKGLLPMKATWNGKFIQEKVAA